jgi:hypothetical protein
MVEVLRKIQRVVEVTPVDLEVVVGLAPEVLPTTLMVEVLWKIRRVVEAALTRILMVVMVVEVVSMTVVVVGPMIRMPAVQVLEAS